MSPSGTYPPKRACTPEKEIEFTMPLVIVTVFFIVLFIGEGFWHLATVAEQERSLRRYQSVEHPHRRTSDRYLDWLG